MLRPYKMFAPPFAQQAAIGIAASIAWWTPSAFAEETPIADVTTPTVSPFDSRDYRVLTLENGLQALLVSDPDADKAAASMNVRVGSAQDPDDLQGLAHFLEHMLFLGARPTRIRRLPALYFG